MPTDTEQVIARVAEWASNHSNVTPLDGTDRDSPTFGDLRTLLTLARQYRGGDETLVNAGRLVAHELRGDDRGTVNALCDEIERLRGIVR